MADHQGDCPLAMKGIIFTGSSLVLHLLFCAVEHHGCIVCHLVHRKTDPSAIIPDSIAASRKPAFPNLSPITANKVQMVWKTPSRRTMWLNCCGCFHITSAAFAYKAWSKTLITLWKWRVFVMFCAWHRSSYTVNMLVAGPWIVGR